MRIVGLFDYYFLILVFIQFLISNFVDVKALIQKGNEKEALVLKWITRGILVITIGMTIISYVYQ
ncbi:MAG: CLC_0170 family protein [Solirubrobacterales bacterium]